MKHYLKGLEKLAILICIAAILDIAIGSFPYCVTSALVVFILSQQKDITDFKKWAVRPSKAPRLSNKSWQLISETIQKNINKNSTASTLSQAELLILQDVSDSLPDAHIVIDNTGNITGYNRAATSMLGIDKSNLGGSLAALVEQSNFVSLTRGEIPDNITEFPSPLDEKLRLEARYTVLDETKAVVLVRDVTQLNRLLSMRQDFIANVSHELRTPLTVIVGYLETLLSEELDLTTTKEVLSKLESPSNRMQALVDDLLLLTRLEAAPQPSVDELIPIDMTRLIDQIIFDGKAMSKENHTILPIIETKKVVLGVETEMHSACSNLVQNAIRYSPEGGTITIAWQPLENGGARFSVTDKGIGIPQEHLNRITERFYRIDFNKARIRGGTGLGLAIVKHVLVRHSTNLSVSSELGDGSSFFFDFRKEQLAPEPIENKFADK